MTYDAKTAALVRVARARGLDANAVLRILDWFDGDHAMVKVVLRNQSLLEHVNASEGKLIELHERGWDIVREAFDRDAR